MSFKPPLSAKSRGFRYATPRAASIDVSAKHSVMKPVVAKDSGYCKKRSLSMEKTRHLQTASPRQGSVPRSRNLRSTSKLVSGHPGPGEPEQIQTGARKDYFDSLAQQAKDLLQTKQFDHALVVLKKLIQENPRPEWQYKKALCLVYLKQHKEAIPELLNLIADHPSHCKEMYTTLAMCFLAVSDHAAAVRLVSKGIARFPRFFEGLVVRGQLFNRERKWDKAVSDFYKAIDVSPSDGRGYVGLAEALCGMGDKRKALKMLNKARHCKRNQTEALLKRATVLFHLQEYPAALADLEQVLAKQPESAEAYYYKAMTYFAQENFVNSALCLEQVIKFDSSKVFVGPAIYNLGTIRIKQRDFYGALHTFKRAETSQVQQVPEQKVLQGFVNAVLSLMKRHFDEGVAALTAIIRKKHPMLKDYIGKCFAYRGFGHASLERHEAAVKDFVVAHKQDSLDQATQYNFLVSQGILVAQKDLPGSLEIFDKASEVFSTNLEPLVYKAAALFQIAVGQHQKKLAEEALDLLNKVISQREDESDLHFFRAIVKYFLGNAVDAIPDLETAIDKAEDNMPMHFLVKGICYAQLKLYQEAMHDFSIVLQLDEQSADALYFRGRCAFILQDTEGAFADYQQLLSQLPNDPLVHVRAGDLLMLIGSFEDAVHAYNNANTAHETALGYSRLVTCYLSLNDTESALAALDRTLELEASSETEFDRTVLETLATAHSKEDLTASLVSAINTLSRCLTQPSSGKLCSFKYVHWFKGVFLFYLGQFKLARAEFKTAIRKYSQASEDESVDPEDIELVYNVALCSLMREAYEDALVELHEIAFLVEHQDRGKILLILGLLQLALSNEAEATELIEEAVKYDPDTVNGYLENQDATKILPLSCLSKYACTFPMAKATVGKSNALLLRPSFRFPRGLMPRITFEAEDAALKEFAVSTVKCKPEAPWLNRVKGSIQFTDEVQDILTEVVSQSSVEESEQAESDYDFEATKTKKCHSATNLSYNPMEGTSDLVNAYFDRRRAHEFEFSDDSSDILDF